MMRGEKRLGFTLGDHVKVTHGPGKGARGIVVGYNAERFTVDLECTPGAAPWTFCAVDCKVTKYAGVK